MNSPKFWKDFIASTGYNHRANQDELVDAITDALNERSYLLARAGTGTGKSLASVIPALHYAVTRASTEHGGPVIVSTATKALQGQYFNKDLPFMSSNYTLPKAKAPGFEFAVLKGKRNYLCLDKLNQPSAPMPEGMLKKLKELPLTHSGDVSTLGLTRPQQMALTISTEECPGAAECLFNQRNDDGSGGCYYERAREKAMQSQVMVINHALLAMYIKILHATEGLIHLLPEPAVMVLDECHKFVGYMQNALGWSLNRKRLLRWANDALDGDDLEEFKTFTKAFFESIEFDKKDKKHPQQIVPRDFLSSSKNMYGMLSIVRDALQYWQEEAMDSKSNEDRKRARRTANMLADLEVMAIPDEQDNFWVELDRDENKVLSYRPSEHKTAAFLKKNMWPLAPSILLSATTPPPHKLGLPSNTEEFDADSPFDFYEQSRLYVSPIDGAPPYNATQLQRQMWEKSRYDEMFNLVAASDGRALLLFTSWADLNKAYEYLAPKFEGRVKILKQDRENESERDRLAKEFTEDEHSVLFGTESFFEGIDVQGKSLQLVVISKLPFPAMEDATKGGKLEWKDMLLDMRMKLVQAAGRLIRSHTDQGLVAVIDTRLATKPYGRAVLSNISPFNEMQRVRSLREAMEYLESLEDE